MKLSLKKGSSININSILSEKLNLNYNLNDLSEYLSQFPQYKSLANGLANGRSGVNSELLGNSSDTPVNLVMVVDKDSNRNYVDVVEHNGKKVVNEDIKEKCHAYFKELYHKDSNWNLNKHESVNDIFERKVFDDSVGWMKDQLEKLKKSRESDYENKNEEERGPRPEKFVNDFDRMKIELKHGKLEKHLNEVENEIVNEVKHLQAYLKCYAHDPANFEYLVSQHLEKRDEKGEEIESTFLQIESKIFPYLSRKWPIFVRWTGERVTGPPDMAKYLNEEARKVDEDFNWKDLNAKKFIIRQENANSNYDVPLEKSFFSEFKSRINGRGIVTSSANPFLDDTLALIRALRAVGNKLPIQIFHKGDLTSKSQIRIIEEARRNDIKFPEDSQNKLKGMDKYKDRIDFSFPKQEVWFVNVERAISNEYKESFVSYANKLLAYMFNSFDEMLLVDSDIVPYVTPEQFFNSSQYRQSQSLFFKDRSHDETISVHDTNFFAKMLPTDLQQVFFGIEPATERTTENRYMKLRFKHYMESGVVALQRTKFWDGIMISVQLSFWKPVMERVWGDKELFWLSQSISGNEDYMFNENHVASIGELSKNREDKASKEICATHPGHISSDDNSLVWINSGILTCKRTDAAERDLEGQRSKGFDNAEQVKQWYESPLKITHAIIPPDSGLYDVENDKDEPNRGWRTTGLCWGYFWCAYDKIGGSDLPEHQGQLIEFSKEEVVWHDYIGSVYKG